MEFLRFGGNQGGSYWGCCAADVIQNFNVDPDAKAAIQLIVGDSGAVVVDNKGRPLFAGPTYRDIFWQRLRFGTFERRDMPNHAFFAIITQHQIQGTNGKKWLAILNEAGFEFIRTINNSVYTGSTIAVGKGQTEQGSSANYLFGLFRNIGSGHANNPFMPPKEWRAMKHPAPQMYDFWDRLGTDVDDFVAEMQKSQKAVWDKLPSQSTLMTEEEAKKAGATIWVAGQRDRKKAHIKSTPPLKISKPAAAPSPAVASPVLPPAAG